jgi:hypothetical protein
MTKHDFVQVLPSDHYSQRQQRKIGWHGYIEQVRGDCCQVVFIDRQRLWFNRNELRLVDGRSEA